MHPLDRPVWTALTTRLRGAAQGDGRALRLDPAIGIFAAAADSRAENLAALRALIPDDGVIGLVESGLSDLPPATRIVSQAWCVQMIAPRFSAPLPAFDFNVLDDGDAPEMLALATLTEPGPFFARTHELGDFIGVRHNGQLIAMAGERMKAPGFTEVSGVCTRPGFRGRGYAAGLLAAVAYGIAARGETPFLHAYADHTATIALYERLGFTVRARLSYTIIEKI